jgi:hypothetical protein
MRPSLILALTLVAASAAFAAGPPLDNTDIIRMVKAGLSSDVILAKIESSETAFDTATDALVHLGEAKVPDDVIKAMMARAGTAATTTKPPATPAQTAATPGAGPTEPNVARGELLLAEIYRTRGLCTALGDLRATKETLIFLPTKITKVCEEYFSKAEFDLPFAAMKEVCFEYAVSGTLAITLKDGQDFSLKESIPRIEGLEKKLKAAHPELPFHCD